MLAALAAGVPLGAQRVRPDSVPTLGTALVSGRRSGPGAAPRFALDSARVARLGLGGAAGLARHLPAAAVRDYGGPTGLKTLSVRALGAAHTSVTVDGLPVSDLLTGQTDLGRIAPGGIAAMSLEVGGAADLLTPPAALTAATLAVESRLPGGSAHQGRRTAGRAAARGGSWGEAGARLELGGAAGAGWRLGAGAGYLHATGDYRFRLDNLSLHTHERRSHSLFQQADLRLQARRTAPQGARTDLGLAFTHDYRQLPGPVVLYTRRGTENLRDNRFEATGRHERRNGPWRLMAAGRAAWAGNRYHDRDPQQPGGLLERTHRTAELYAAAGAAFVPPRARGLGLALTADYTLQRLASSEPGSDGAARHTLAAAAAVAWHGPRLALTARLGGATLPTRAPRLGQRQATVRTLSPEASARLTLWRRGAAAAALRLHWRRSVRPPSFSDSYFYRLGSPALRPERVRQLGAGLTAALPSGAGRWTLRLSADAYVQQLDDRISAVPLSPYLWRMDNRGRAGGPGLDLAAEAELRLGRGHGLSVAGALSRTGVRDRTDRSGAAYGRRPAYVPATWGSASAQWRNPWADVRLGLTASGRRWSTDEHAAGTCMAGYAELTAGLHRRFACGGLGLDLTAECANLTDTHYELVRRYPMPGRTWRVALAVEF